MVENFRGVTWLYKGQWPFWYDIRNASATVMVRGIFYHDIIQK